MNALPLPRVVGRAVGTLLVALFVLAPVLARAAEVLEVRLDETTPGTLLVGVRDAGGKAPSIRIGDVDAGLTEAGRFPSARFQPLVIVIDTAHMSAAVLEQVRSNVVQLVDQQFAMGNQLVVLGDQTGKRVEILDPKSAAATVKKFVLGWQPAADPKSKTPTSVGALLPQLMQLSVTPKTASWALIFSALCVGDDEEPKPPASWRGPARFMTFSKDVDPHCVKNRERWFAELKLPGKELIAIDDGSDAAKTALLGPGPKDEVVTYSGYEFVGGEVAVNAQFEGEATAWNRKFFGDSMPAAWDDYATKKAATKTKLMFGVGFALLLTVVIGFVLLKARGGAAEVAKWEAVGEAVDLSHQMDPDAWNATIFQLTGAMPVIKEIQQAAQLGPSAKDPEATVQAPRGNRTSAPAPIAPAPTPMPTPTPAPTPKAASQTAAETAHAPKGGGPAPATGMTVAMPVLDDGTGYEAAKAFEIGVLLSGRPVARKTKKFKRVFSVGRATDNRVVIQKDDTVHRYHVVVRPALEGKEWWLEVSPTATNRTNLNGKDLKAGGRYRLPGRFRLQLGEATELRGRMVDD